MYNTVRMPFVYAIATTLHNHTKDIEISAAQLKACTMWTPHWSLRIFLELHLRRRWSKYQTTQKDAGCFRRIFFPVSKTPFCVFTPTERSSTLAGNLE